MTATVFESRPLPEPLADIVLDRLEQAHRQEPFSALDPRLTVHRAARIVGELGVSSTIYRGGLDLRGAEVDHLWLAAYPRLPETSEASPRNLGDVPPDPPTAPSWALFVVDVAFPLFAEEFVEVLRRFVAGDVTPAELDEIASTAGVCDRVVGLFPKPIRYLGAPVWSARG